MRTLTFIFALFQLLLTGCSGNEEKIKFVEPKHLFALSTATNETTTTVEIVLKHNDRGFRGRCLVEFDHSYSIITETFNDEGYAIVHAGGVFIGSHVVKVYKEEEGRGGKADDVIMFDILPNSNQRRKKAAGRGQATGEKEEEARIALQSSNDDEYSCKKHRIGIVDSIPSSGIDGQRSIFLAQMTHLSKERFSFRYIFAGQWDEESVLVKSVAALADEVAIVKGQVVRSDEEAERIARMFRAAEFFWALDPNLQEAFRELCSSLSDLDVAVLFHHREHRDFHDHYLVDLCRLCGVTTVVVELPLSPTKVVVDNMNPTAFVAPSDYVKIEYQEMGGSREIVVINPAGAGGGEGRDRWVDKRQHKFSVASVMRLDPDKSPLLLLKAVAYILRLRPDLCSDAVFKVAGIGSLKEQLVGVVEELGIPHCIDFVGGLSPDEVSRLLQTSDIFVNPTLYQQTWSMSNVEAMYHAVPVVAYEAGGADYLLNGTNCLVPESPTAEDLGEAILSLMEEGDLREILGNAGKRTVIDRKLTVRGMVSKCEEFYLSKINENNGGR